jgi:hypothetical protein
MRPLGHGGGAASQNPAASPAVLAGDGAGEDLGFVRDRLVCGFGAERPPVSGAAALAAATGGAGEEGSLGNTDWLRDSKAS